MPVPRYQAIIEEIFSQIYVTGKVDLAFPRQMIFEVADHLQIDPPKNAGDLIYTYRSRRKLPKRIRDTAPLGFEWQIRSQGNARYAFTLRRVVDINPSDLRPVNIPEITPELVTRFSLSDEQSLLARIRYNKLIDLFVAGTCFHLQSHLRTSIPSLGQVETDDIYIGIDRNRKLFIMPVQAKK